MSLLKTTCVKVEEREHIRLLSKQFTLFYIINHLSLNEFVVDFAEKYI